MKAHAYQDQSAHNDESTYCRCIKIIWTEEEYWLHSLCYHVARYLSGV